MSKRLKATAQDPMMAAIAEVEALLGYEFVGHQDLALTHSPPSHLSNRSPPPIHLLQFSSSSSGGLRQPSAISGRHLLRGGSAAAPPVFAPELNFAKVMLDQMAPLVDESWRAKFERVREDGFSGLRGFWVLREIVIPIISKLLTALCVPYVFARGLFPVLGYPLIVNSAVYRFAWLGCLLFSVVFFCAKRFHVWFTNLHNSIRDDRYLIGRRLHDFSEDPVDKSNEQPPIIPQIQGNMNLSADAGLMHREQEADAGLRMRQHNNPQMQHLL